MKTIEQEYHEWLDAVHDGKSNLSEIQYTAMKEAFVAGAFVNFIAVSQTSDIESEDIAVTKLDDIYQDLIKTMEKLTS